MTEDEGPMMSPRRDSLGRKLSCPIPLDTLFDETGKNGKKPLSRTVSFNSSVSVRRFDKMSTYWEHDFWDGDLNNIEEGLVGSPPSSPRPWSKPLSPTADEKKSENLSLRVPPRSEMRHYSNMLIFYWHKEDIDLNFQNAYSLDSGRIRRRFGGDWATYFRFRLERFPIIALHGLARLASRPENFFVEDDDNRELAMDHLYEALDLHASVAKQSCFRSRCGACDAIEESIAKNLKCTKIVTNGQSSKGMKRVSSLPIISDSNGSLHDLSPIRGGGERETKGGDDEVAEVVAKVVNLELPVDVCDSTDALRGAGNVGDGSNKSKNVLKSSLFAISHFIHSSRRKLTG